MSNFGMEYTVSIFLQTSSSKLWLCHCIFLVKLFCSNTIILCSLCRQLCIPLVNLFFQFHFTPIHCNNSCSIFATGPNLISIVRWLRLASWQIFYNFGTKHDSIFLFFDFLHCIGTWFVFLFSEHWKCFI